MTSAFQRLHPSIQRVLWDLKWDALRDLQVKAIDAWHLRTRDLLLMAPTAAGKTEAAFLPILSHLAADHGAGSIRAVYIGPLKALINDQFRRAEQLCERTEIPVHRWHGDVDFGQKQKVLRAPSGVLLITPESLEALFVRRGRQIRRLFEHLDAIVIDEVHAFIDGERGRQLASLLVRLDNARHGLPRARRVGLSATIGCVEQAQSWLSGTKEPAELLTSSAQQAVELMIKTFVAEPAPLPILTTKDDRPEDVDEDASLIAVAEHILEHLYGSTHLVFGNRKADIEALADTLRRLCESQRIPDRFLVHHGSLSRVVREHVESELQSGRPCTALCSSTLEMGIDVGSVDSVGQFRAPRTVSSLRQRLGRSGRRTGQASRLWLYVPVRKVDGDADLNERLYPELLQAIAVTQLLLEKWVEPPWENNEDYSTLVQQALSILSERGGAKAQDLFRIVKSGTAFNGVTPEFFAQFLRDLGAADLVEQTPTGDLILGLEGERMVENYEFYSAFPSPDEYDVLDGAPAVGKLTILDGDHYDSGDHILLAGRRWEIIVVDVRRRVIQVRKASKKQPLSWGGGVGAVHPRVRQKMFQLLADDAVPNWLNESSRRVLEWSRTAARESGVLSSPWVSDGGRRWWLFTFTGDRANHALELVFKTRTQEWTTVRNIGIGLILEGPGTRDDLLKVLRHIASDGLNASALLDSVFAEKIPSVGKHGNRLSSTLRARSYAAAQLDVNEGVRRVQELLGLK